MTWNGRSVATAIFPDEWNMCEKRRWDLRLETQLWWCWKKSSHFDVMLLIMLMMLLMMDDDDDDGDGDGDGDDGDADDDDDDEWWWMMKDTLQLWWCFASTEDQLRWFFRSSHPSIRSPFVRRNSSCQDGQTAITYTYTDEVSCLGGWFPAWAGQPAGESSGNGIMSTLD